MEVLVDDAEQPSNMKELRKRTQIWNLDDGEARGLTPSVRD
jgi:hypothetical protein